MPKSITETFQKINIDLAGKPFFSILATLLILIVFMAIQITLAVKSSSQGESTFIESQYHYNPQSEGVKFNYIYASSRGSKYYFYNCKASIKEENKIFFETELAAKSQGYSLAKACQ